MSKAHSSTNGQYNTQALPANRIAALPTGAQTLQVPSRSPPSDTVSTVNGNHGENGRFTAGNKAAAGNPHARRMPQLRKSFLAAATEERVCQLAEKQFDLAIAGDMIAAQLALLYALGRPAEVVDPDRLDVEELKLAMEMPGMVGEELPLALVRLPAWFVVALVRGFNEMKAQRYLENRLDPVACKVIQKLAGTDRQPAERPTGATAHPATTATSNPQRKRNEMKKRG